MGSVKKEKKIQSKINYGVNRLKEKRKKNVKKPDLLVLNEKNVPLCLEYLYEDLQEFAGSITVR